MSFKNAIIRVLDILPLAIRIRIKNIPVVKQTQAFLINRYLTNREFEAKISTGPAKGLVFPVQLPQDKLMWIGTWELDFAMFLSKTVQAGWVCYDIGGYKGYYAGIMAIKGAREVLVFEPEPNNANTILKLLSLNPGLPIRLIQNAISDKTGKAAFKIMPQETMGKLEKSAFQQDEIEQSQIEVACTSLDELAVSQPQPHFIKIDVEGAEELVLQGGIKLLENKKPVLMVEIHSRDIGRRCMTLLKGIYSKVYVFETGAIPDGNEPEICHYIAMD